jgi:hypothetical protein
MPSTSSTIHIQPKNLCPFQTLSLWRSATILFHKAKKGFARHPAEMGSPEIKAAFLSYLAQEAFISTSTQKHAFKANFIKPQATLYHQKKEASAIL